MRSRKSSAVAGKSRKRSAARNPRHARPAPVRLGIIGLGVRTEVLLASLFAIEGVETVAVCDVREAAVAKILGIFARHGKPAPAVFPDYRRLLEQKPVDAVLAPTSWNSHLPIATDALQAGKYAAIEVGGASSTEELWRLVRAAEVTGLSCMMLENCCYARNELMVMNMVRRGLFGELIHCAGGYEHDLREFACMVEQGYERSIHNRFRNGDIYPTHQLGPIAKILDINRGNRFLSLTSTASKSRGMQLATRRHYGAGTPFGDIAFNMGDIVTTVIKCANGETVTLTHGIALPRPYSRNGRVQGTRGIWLEDANGIYIDGVSPSNEEIDVAGNPYTTHKWDPVDSFYEQYDHPIWQAYRRQPLVGGHGGLDSLALRAFLDAVRNRTETPIDVYDVAAWMSVTCLSEQSIALGSQPVAIPDFTDGKWITRGRAPAGPWTL
jgi:predicted dehydrogenase